IEQEVATQEEIEAVRNDVRQAIEDALEFARQSPYPEPEDLFTDLYSDPLPAR
ncbi:MAG TPA: pyruvate dehydrogenase (acetyl-transferring) E1 component subunit alpha, partial [Dehalococcoidia bacterium]|nr:pyruvate dehydrogenase (acetyl-transferring) E1 component subunit alpha [Dehalococcoidia bacterium]